MKTKSQHPLEIVVKPLHFQKPNLVVELKALGNLPIPQFQWNVFRNTSFLNPAQTLMKND